MTFALIAVALAGPGDPPVPHAPDAIDLGEVRSPYAAQAPVPAVAGETSTFDLASLGRTSSVFTVTLDTTSIGRITNADAGAILSHLAADPAWRVARYDGVLGAAARLVKGSEAHVGWDGFHEGWQEAWRVLVRFEAWPADAAWATSDLVARIPAGESTLTANGFFLLDPWAGFKTTALSIEGAHLSVDAYEARRSGKRARTIDALSTTLPLLDALAAHADLVRAQGHIASLFPKMKARRDAPIAEIESPGAGLLTVRAWVNPGRAGWAWARVLDETLAPWEEAALMAGTRERIGYSADPAETFMLQGTFPAPEGPRAAGTLEIWFVADEGGPPDRLVALPVMIPRR